MVGSLAATPRDALLLDPAVQTMKHNDPCSVAIDPVPDSSRSLRS
jgi:hypothetical protein